MPVAHYQIKISVIQQMIFDARENQRGVTFTDLRNDDSDREATLASQRTGHEIGTIVEFARRSANPFLRVPRNRLCRGRAIDNQRDGRLGQSEVLGEYFQAYAWGRRPATQAL